MPTRLTPDETHEFLLNQRTLILSTLKKGGAPVAHALWYTYVDDALYFSIQAGSFKHKNILRDNRVSCLIEAGESYFELRGVMVQGRCTEVTSQNEMERVRQAGEEKHARIGSGLEEMPPWFSNNRTQRQDRSARVLLKVSMDQVTTWNFSQVREHYTQVRS